MNVEAIQNLTPDQVKLVFAYYLVRIVIWLFFANTVRNTLMKIAPENRLLKPNSIWLLAVPVFNLFWNFQVVARMADSLTNEFYDRKIAEEENPGKRTGMFFAVTALLSFIPLPPFILITLFLLSAVYFISYWVKINNFRNLLVEHDKFLEDKKK